MKLCRTRLRCVISFSKTVIVGNLCGKFGTFLDSSYTQAVGGAWDSAEADACGSHLRESSTEVIAPLGDGRGFRLQQF